MSGSWWEDASVNVLRAVPPSVARGAFTHGLTNSLWSHDRVFSGKLAEKYFCCVLIFGKVVFVTVRLSRLC